MYGQPQHCELVRLEINRLMSRQLLSRLVGTMFLLLALAFAFVLLNSLFGAKKQTAVFADMAIGETALKYIDGERAWVTHLNTNGGFNAIDDYVVQGQGCDKSGQFCVLAAQTQTRGINLIFSAIAPAQLANDAPWFGGFIDPTNNAVYDLLGRQYISQKDNLRELRVIHAP